MKTIKLLLLLLTVGLTAFGQTPYNMQYGSYTQTFDGLANTGTSSIFPSGWGLFEIDNNADTEYNTGTGSSTQGDTYSFGAAASTDRALGGLLSSSLEPSWGFGFTNNTAYTLTAIDIAATMEQWRASNSTDIDSCYFYYSTTATGISDTAAAWTALSALDLYSAVNPTSGSALDGNLAANQLPISGTITVNMAANATIFFKWVDINIGGSDDGLAVDDLTITLYDASGPLPAGPPTITSTTPIDDDINVNYNLSTLSFTFSDSISVIGSGNITIKDLNNSANDVTVAAASLSQSADGKTFTYNALSLNPSTPYAVEIDAATFSNGINFPGISNNTDWNFTTVAQPTAVTSLNETFTGCNDPNFGAFQAFTVNGGQDWRCTTFGNNDTNAVRMNGFSGGSNDNEDWLISPPLDFSSMTNPYLHFWSKLRFSGNTTKEVMVSTNYTGLGSPAAATWTPLTINNWAALDTNGWKQFTNTDLTSYKSGVFHIAFKYESFSSGTADEWSVDDVLVTNGPLSIGSFSSQDLNVKVLGDVNDALNLQITSNSERTVNLQVLDMAGRRISKKNITAKQGVEQYSIPVSGLVSGMYILQIQNEEGATSVKFIVR